MLELVVLVTALLDFTREIVPGFFAGCTVRPLAEVLFFPGVWANALPAADFEFLEVLPSESVLEAADAALAPVCRFGVLV